MRLRLPILVFLSLVAAMLCALVLVVIAISGCKPSAPTPPKKPPAADTLVIVQGGLGADRTGPLADAIRTRCPRALVLSLGTWDAYKTDPRPVITANPAPHLVLIHHSFAATWVSQPMPHETYDVELDPVNPNWWSNLPAPVADHVDVFWRTDLVGPRVARMPGIVPIIVPGGHDDVPVDTVVIDRVCMTINGL